MKSLSPHAYPRPIKEIHDVCLTQIRSASKPLSCIYLDTALKHHGILSLILSGSVAPSVKPLALITLSDVFCLSRSRSRPGGVEEEGGERSERAVVLYSQRDPEDESRHPDGPSETRRCAAARSRPSAEVRHTLLLTCFSFTTQESWVFLLRILDVNETI